ncbi:hypothetical protein PSM7751_00001 [Pseudooceanicola marinus]|uniref:Prophage CP4-57 regulatory protein (AlpA) n=1 Tax=Pseudooceanicola marinus TaxID=396013 RepID=A0A1X6Y3F5_9RHOB|nr:hypothetical protein [Pseudooceanicola marinus]PJE33451.1 hypothetical protein CVM50_04285 [Pseudooceanicola marinus]SLN09777.1 hypothetical protein PSM7751_00001 [Pseudooceanicola marinus]
MKDRTLTTEAAVGSTRWVSSFLGMSPEAFRNRRKNLESEGFPRPDPILKLYIKADVKAWIENRRSIAPENLVVSSAKKKNINFGAL